MQDSQHSIFGSWLGHFMRGPTKFQKALATLSSQEIQEKLRFCRSCIFQTGGTPGRKRTGPILQVQLYDNLLRLRLTAILKITNMDITNRLTELATNLGKHLLPMQSRGKL